MSDRLEGWICYSPHQSRWREHAGIRSYQRGWYSVRSDPGGLPLEAGLTLGSEVARLLTPATLVLWTVIRCSTSGAGTGDIAGA